MKLLFPVGAALVYFLPNALQARSPSCQPVNTGAAWLTLVTLPDEPVIELLHLREPSPLRLEFVGGRYGKPHPLVGSQFGAIEYNEIYPGIDAVFYRAGEDVEYDLILHPGASLGAVRLAVRGGVGLQLNSSGDLLSRTNSGWFVHRRPVARQGSRTVPTWYELADGEISIHAGTYDTSQVLIIDPVITYATYLGGQGNDELRQLHVNTEGSTYLVGVTDSPNFPVSPNAAQPRCGTDGRCNAKRDYFVTKFTPDGKLQYSTYVGGSADASEILSGVDSEGAVYLADQYDLPVTNILVNRTGGSVPKFRFVKLSSDGSSILAAAGFNLGESNLRAFAVAPDGSVYFSTETTIYKLDTGLTRLVFEKRLGAAVNKMRVDRAGNIVVAGPATQALSVHGTSSAYQPFWGNSNNSFIAKLTPAGDVTFLTYLGGSGSASVNSVAMDAAGAVYVGGRGDGLAAAEAVNGVILPFSHDRYAARFNPADGSLGYISYLPCEPFRLAVDGDRRLAMGCSGDTELSVPVLDPSGRTVAEYPTLPIRGDSNSTALAFDLAFNPAGQLFVGGTFDQAYLYLRTPRATTAAFQRNSGGQSDAGLLRLTLGGNPLKATPDRVEIRRAGPDRYQPVQLVITPSSDPPVWTRYRVSADVPWLQLTESEKASATFRTYGYQPDSITILVSLPGDTPGAVSGTLILQPEGSGDPLLVPINVNVEASTLQTDPATVTLTAVVGLSAEIATSLHVYPDYVPYDASSSADWIRMEFIDARIVLHVDTSRLPVGVSQAALTILKRGSQSPPTIVPVSILMEAPTIVANPGALLLEGPASGGSLVGFLTVAGFLSHYRGALRPGFEVLDPSAPWLQVRPRNGRLQDILEVTADPGGLGEGDYSASFTISLASSGTQINVPVTLRVNDGQGRLLVNPQALAFSVTPLPDGSALSGKQLSIYDSRGGAFTVSGVDSRLLLSQYIGEIPATVTARPDPGTAMLGDKELNGQITISRKNTDKTDTVTIPFSIAASVPRPSVTSVVSSASYAAGPFAPGSLITIFGHELALVPVNPELSPTAPVVITPPGLYYSQTVVSVNSVPIPLLYASPTQVNAIIPMFDFKGVMTLSVNGVGSTAVPITLAAAAPALFMSGEARALAFNANGTPNTAREPATAGEVVRVFAAGLGRVDGNLEAGLPAPTSPLLHPLNKVNATIGQTNAEVVECALQPGKIGVYFVDLRIPNLPGGEHAVVLTSAGQSSNSVFIAVKPAGS